MNNHYVETIMNMANQGAESEIKLSSENTKRQAIELS